MIINLIVASLPAFFFIFIFSLFDKDFVHKRIPLLILSLIVGAIGSYICYRFEMHFGSYFKKVKDSTYLEVLFYAIFGVAIFEEGYKWVISFLFNYFEKYKKPFSVLIYSVFISIGFAWFENIVYYAIPHGINTSISRMFSAFPSHVCNAIWMGLFLILYNRHKSLKKIIYLFLSLIIPILIHALYNSLLYGKDITLMSYNIIYMLIVFSLSTVIAITLFIKNKKLGLK